MSMTEKVTVAASATSTERVNELVDDEASLDDVDCDDDAAIRLNVDDEVADDIDSDTVDVE